MCVGLPIVYYLIGLYLVARDLTSHKENASALDLLITPILALVWPVIFIANLLVYLDNTTIWEKKK